MHTGSLRATIDEEMGKMDPVPSGCGENRPSCVVALDCGLATAFELRLGWTDFPSQRHPAR